MTRIRWCLVLALFSGCASRGSPVRLQGDAVSIAWLGGVWQGEYWGSDSGRRGSLDFHLPSGTDSLSGEVMMLDPMGNVMRSADPADAHRLHAQSARLLSIEIVIAHADTIHGVLEPYIAPDCNCVVSTTFVGRVLGNEIAGTFETRGRAGQRTSGSWRLARTGSTRP